MKVGDMIKLIQNVPQRPVGSNQVGLLISIDRRNGADCNRHSRAATVMTPQGELVTWPLDSHYQIEVIG